MTKLNKYWPGQLNAISSLITALRRTQIVDRELDLSDFDHLFSRLEKISYVQYQEILRLLNINQVKLVKFLISIGLKQK